MRRVLTGEMVLLVLGGVLCAADWPQWRGPARDGVVSHGPALAAEWPKDGPVKIWESEEIPTGGSGGLGSVVVAEGRLYVYVNDKYRVPFDERMLSERGLRNLGWSDKALPDSLRKAVEDARVSPERERLKGRELADWIKKWVEDRLDTEGRKVHGPLVTDRLRRGKDALAFETLDNLAAIKDKQFPNEAALDAWFDETRLDTPTRKKVMSQVPTFNEKARDQVLCLDAATGKTLWRRPYEGRPDAWSASGTPCVAEGRCLVAGSDGVVYCLDARTGEEQWKVKVTSKKVQSSVLVADGLAVVLADQLSALSIETGAVVWRQPKVKGLDNSPVLWRHQTKAYVICNTGRDIGCVDLADGALKWTAPGGGMSTAVVAGDRLVVLSARKDVGLAAYTLSPEKPERLWAKPDLMDGGASPIVTGEHVYAVGKDFVVCVRLASGEVLWQEKVAGNGHTSPVLADGKLIAVIGKDLVLLAATPGKHTRLATAKVKVSEWPSPALVNGRLYLRMQKSIACFDVRAEVPAAESAHRSAQ